MKKICVRAAAALAIAALTVMTAACARQSEPVHIASSDIGDVSGEAIEGEEISALCPDGWKNIEVMDAYADEANTPASNELRFVKGGSTQADLLTHAYIDIVLYGANEAPAQSDAASKYDEVAEISPIVTGDVTWSGYSGRSLGVPFVHLTTNTEEHVVDVWLYTPEVAETSAAITDADVLAVLQSITF